MRISSETIENKLAIVPEEIRAHVTSDEVAEMLGKIAEEHGLHIDQAGILDEETLYVMLGLENTSGFVNRISATLGISEASAESIVKDINDQVFGSIRSALQKTTASNVSAPIATPESSDSTNRESILAEIENPTPTIHPISAADQTIAGPAVAREVISAPIPATVPMQMAAQAEKPAPDFLAAKLTGSVNTPTQTVADKVPMPSVKPKSYATDPYREPIA